MTDPITPTGKVRFANFYDDYEAGTWFVARVDASGYIEEDVLISGLSSEQASEAIASFERIERESREPTDDGFWADVDSLAAALRKHGLSSMETSLQVIEVEYRDGKEAANAHREQRYLDDAAAIIQAAKEAERE